MQGFSVEDFMKIRTSRYNVVHLFQISYEVNKLYSYFRRDTKFGFITPPAYTY